MSLYGCTFFVGTLYNYKGVVVVTSSKGP